MFGPSSRAHLLAAFTLAVLLGAMACMPAARAAGNDSSGESHTGTELVLRALSLLGVNYKFGGNSPDTGLDCSGLVRHLFREAVGVVLPRRAEEMSRAGETIDTAQLKPGDLVFFNTLRRTFSHVGIYIGNDQFVHAPSSGGAVRVEHMSKQYWAQRFSGARRLLAAGLGLDRGAASTAPSVAQAPAQLGSPNTPILPLTGPAAPRPQASDLINAQPLVTH